MVRAKTGDDADPTQALARVLIAIYVLIISQDGALRHRVNQDTLNYIICMSPNSGVSRPPSQVEPRSASTGLRGA